jgi:hypothetical protein
VVRHSDQGVQYVAVRRTQRLAGAVASVGSTGYSYDNALAEAFTSLLEAELLRNKGSWRSIDDVETAVASTPTGSIIGACTARSASCPRPGARTPPFVTTPPRQLPERHCRASAEPATEHLHRFATSGGRPVPGGRFRRAVR